VGRGRGAPRRPAGAGAPTRVFQRVGVEEPPTWSVFPGAEHDAGLAALGPHRAAAPRAKRGSTVRGVRLHGRSLGGRRREFCSAKDV